MQTENIHDPSSTSVHVLEQKKSSEREMYRGISYRTLTLGASMPRARLCLQSSSSTSVTQHSTRAFCTSNLLLQLQGGSFAQLEKQEMDRLRREQKSSDEEKIMKEGTPEKGLLGKYGKKGADAYHSMVTNKGTGERLKITVPPLRGKATKRGTRETIERSTVFDTWYHDAPEEAGGFRFSKLGCVTCRMPFDSVEGADSLQLQIIKGMNTIMIDGSVSEQFEGIMKGLNEVLTAFELEREGILVVVKGGTMVQKAYTEQQTKWDQVNSAGVRDRFKGTVSRFQAGNLPAMSFKTGFNFKTMTDEELMKLQLIRMPRWRYYQPTVAAITPMWLEACLTNVAGHTQLETIDIFLVEGICALYNSPLPAEMRQRRLEEMFEFLEEQVRCGVLQYYGISSPQLAPDVPRVYPEYPADNMLPPQFKSGWQPHKVINLYEVMAAAEKAGGKNHHLRYISYPFNLTEHQAYSTPLPYDSNHTLKTLCDKFKLTTLGFSPVQTIDLQGFPVRYHRYPLVPDLRAARLNFFNMVEKAIGKETEVTPTLEKMKKFEDQELLSQLFAASFFVGVQRACSNLHWFEEFLETYLYPKFRDALMHLKEGSSKDLKDWASAYESLVYDAMRFRMSLFQHRHGLKTIEINNAIDRICPKLSTCPIVTQKAINFALHGSDVCCPAFHMTRYFHEATELNPFKGGKMSLTDEEMRKLCSAPEVSFCAYNPPHPYMMEMGFSKTQGKFGKQPSPSAKYLQEVDPRKGNWPDIPDSLEGMAGDAAAAEKGGVPSAASGGATSTESHKGPDFLNEGTIMAPMDGAPVYPPGEEKMQAAMKSSGKRITHITRYFPRSV